MAKKGGTRTCRECSRWKEVKDKMRIAELLGAAADSFTKKTEEFKPTLAEYLKLIQLEKEFEEEQPRDIRVMWVEPGGDKKP
jgi:hypothetical protein